MASKFLRHLNFSNIFKFFLISLTFQLVGCATSSSGSGQRDLEGQEVSAIDPYEGFNRTMFKFNDTLDSYLFEPIVDGYKWITPDILETGVSNVFTNMKGISVVINDILQGKLKQGAQDTGRFLINSTVGVGGIFDVATHAGLEQNDEDFAQTLAVWGVPRGPYLVLPVLGPATFRGIPGAVVDSAANPVSYLGWPVAAMAALERRASEDGSLQFIDEAAVDPYVFTREAYIQHREYLAADGEVEYNSDDLLADLDDPEEDFDLLSDAGALGIQNDTLTGDGPNESESTVKTVNDQTQQERGSDDTAKKTPEEVKQEQQEHSPEFEKAMRSFKKATKSYHRADKELELIKKGDLQSR